MRSRRLIQGIDSHTAGCPLRVVTSGFGPIRGATMADKRADLMTRDGLRRLVLFEPRGSFNLPAAVLTEACSPDADIGMIILEPDTYPPMCGHCAMAVATVAVETGMLPAPDGGDGSVTVRLDTPAGVVPARVRVAAGRALDVTLQMPPSFLYREAVPLQTSRFGTVTGTIAFGGDFYLIVEAAALGLTLDPAQSWALVQAAAELRAAAQAHPVQHPTLAHANQLYQIELVGPGDDTVDGRNVVVCPPTVIDRSPCGTGTAARMAALHAHGQLAPGDQYRHAGILGTVFTGTLGAPTTVGSFDAVAVEVTGSAYVTGTFTLFQDPDDPFPDGFRLAGV